MTKQLRIQNSNISNSGHNLLRRFVNTAGTCFFDKSETKLNYNQSKTFKQEKNICQSFPYSFSNSKTKTIEDPTPNPSSSLIKSYSYKPFPVKHVNSKSRFTFDKVLCKPLILLTSSELSTYMKQAFILPTRPFIY